MARRHCFAISRRVAPEVYNTHSPRIIGGRRECRAPDAPAAACVLVESTRVSHHGHTGNTRHSPRNGFNGFLRALPGDRAFLPPSPAKTCFRQLDASVGASGPHDFAVRNNAARHASLWRPPHPAPNVRDDAYAPLAEAGRRINKAASTKRRSEIFLLEGLDTILRDAPAGQINQTD
ncbi:hypothetical protein GALL_418260 [mine drainage metagenome]|uniref:Uncharacterized protein n=1 Tax=mine drainage metagenome TaxID=410659 RepID=A0A1J5PYD6_9ZZZZ